MAKKLSPAMFAWAKANKSKLKNPTPAQKKIFAAYNAMVKAGDKPANPKPRPTPKAAPKTAPKTQPKSNDSNGRSRFFRGSSGTRGQNLPSNPQLKSQPKKPKRSDFATGRSGASAYAAALRKYNSKNRTTNRSSIKPKVNRRGRRV
jgi:hypothetical protein|tara:strand:+ start:90 stop:530 length:441 start_codon:yes stop_codon:yes gene_type:complete